MAEHGITQKQVAEAIGRTQPYVSDRSRGLDAWNTSELVALAGLMGYGTPWDFFNEVTRRCQPKKA